MNSANTLIETLDDDLSLRVASRRDLFFNARARLGAVATAPMLLATVASQAFGATLPAKVAEVLNFALTLEYLEDEFYRMALSHNGLIRREFVPVFAQISKHETAHVKTLSGALGSAAVAKPKFDLTAGGKYHDVFTNFDTFTAVSQTFEDTGVAAYKGQAPALVGGGALLTVALQIHSVEARHAAEVRRIRGGKSWVGAFDQPMTKSQVLAAVKPFIVG